MTTIHEELAVLSPERRKLLELLLARQGLDRSILPIPRRSAVDALPLSFTQERLWMLAEMAPNSPLGNVPVAFHIQGRMNVDAFKECLDELRQRHAVLRTTFPLRDGRPTQCVVPATASALPVIDLRTLPTSGRWDEARRLLTREARRPFSPAREPMFRACVWRLDTEESVLLLLFHHLVVDGYAVRVLVRELSALYRAASSGGSCRLADPPIQYGDFAHWQRESLRGETLESLVSYWERQLRGCTPVPDLPGMRRQPGMRSFHGALRLFALSESLSEALRELSRREGVTLFMTLVCAFQVLLRAYTHQDDVQVATSISNRSRPETERLAGNLGNNVVLRLDLSGDPTIRDVLQQVRRIVLDAHVHQELPLEVLRDELRRRGSAVSVPPLKVMLIVRDSTLEENFELSGVSFVHMPVDLETAWLDLSLDIIEARAIHGAIEYRTDAFDESAISKILTDFERVLDRVAADPDSRLSDVSGGVSIPAQSLNLVTHAFIEPRTTVERRLQEIWEKVLQVQPIGVGANFFEIGGHSLLVGQLLHEIELAFGARLPVQTVLNYPTLEGLARVLSESAPPVRIASLVPLQPHGSRPPLFAVHAGDDFNEVARLLGADQPFYGLTAQGGLDGRQRPYHPSTSVQELAALYLQCLRERWPEGPYVLAGHCFGGLVAFEMARQLEAQGQQVAAVVLIDSFPVMLREEADPAVSGRVHRHLRRLSELGLGERVSYLRKRVGATLEWQLVNLRSAQERLQIEASCHWHLALRRPIPAETLRRRFTWVAARMLRQYRPEPFSGRVLLFHSKSKRLCHPDIWRRLAVGGVEAHELATTHSGLLQAPFAETLAEITTRYLDQACARCRTQGTERFA